MSRICNKAQQEKIVAIYVFGQLIIWAQGQKPTPCHEVRIERWPFRIYPPQYQIVACVDEGRICPQMLMPYKVAGFFSVSKETLEAMGGFAVVHHSGGAERVQVEVLEMPAEQEKKKGIKVANGGGGGMPSPFAAGGDVPFPFRMANFIETGSARDIEFVTRSDESLHTATGYSEAFSFREAFQNAVDNLPPDTNPYPDKLTNVRVVGTGAEFGGIAGLHRMYVAVSSFY
jgi:hypothetical protein